jgi:predicted nucleotidyltransferase
MKHAWPSLAPLLRSDAQGLMLAALYLDPDREFTLSQLAQWSETSVASAMREVDRLVEAQFLLERRVGRSRLVRVNKDHKLTKSVQELVLYSYGPQVVIHRLLEGVAGISEAYIFGSWARRLNGEIGADPQDVDVLLVGEMSMRYQSEMELRAALLCGRDVNIKTVSSKEWSSPTDSFWRTVKEGTLVSIGLQTRH